MPRPSTVSGKTPETADEQVGANLHALRSTRNLRGEDVASNIGVSVVTYLRHERGERGVSMATLARLARYFNVKPSKLIAGIENFVE